MLREARELLQPLGVPLIASIFAGTVAGVWAGGRDHCRCRA